MKKLCLYEKLFTVVIELVRKLLSHLIVFGLISLDIRTRQSAISLCSCHVRFYVRFCLAEGPVLFPVGFLMVLGAVDRDLTPGATQKIVRLGANCTRVSTTVLEARGGRGIVECRLVAGSCV